MLDHSKLSNIGVILMLLNAIGAVVLIVPL